jgi:2-keto-4-pentenoate hydratase
MSFDAEGTARFLLDARREHARIERIDPAFGPRTGAEGAAAQLAMARLLGAEHPAGFKIGATGKTMQAYLGLSTPAAGFMEAANVHASGATLPLSGLPGLGVECELAVRLDRDLPAGPCTPERAAEAVGAVMAGIEIVQNRYGDLAAVGTPALIADQMFHRAAIIGGGRALAGLDLAALVGRISVNGRVVDEGAGAELLGHPLNCLAWLAESPVAAAFGGLRAGQVVMLGSVTPPIWLDGPAEVEVAFLPLEPVSARVG